MPPRVVPLAFLVFALASCATASGNGGPDGGQFDGRTRADADPGADASGVDAPASDPDASSDLDAALAGDVLLISEIVDADLSGGLPKFVELTNLGGSTLDLSEFSLGIFSNGAFTISGGVSTVLSGSLAPGDSHVVSFENGDTPGSSSFRTVYGFDADDMSFGAFINGNDTIALFLGPATGDGSDATLVDVYGVIGTDGSGEAWEYLDGFAARKQTSITASPVFIASDWDFSGVSALDSVDAAGIAAATSPGSH